MISSIGAIQSYLLSTNVINKHGNIPHPLIGKNHIKHLLFLHVIIKPFAMTSPSLSGNSEPLKPNTDTVIAQLLSNIPCLIEQSQNSYCQCMQGSHSHREQEIYS